MKKSTKVSVVTLASYFALGYYVFSAAVMLKSLLDGTPEHLFDEKNKQGPEPVMKSWRPPSSKWVCLNCLDAVDADTKKWLSVMTMQGLCCSDCGMNSPVGCVVPDARTDDQTEKHVVANQ
jgi:hypothetical protein